ncbi:MAG: hypothetical protein RMY29_003160 [Nostoc sp. CreGUA01]
MERGGGRGAGEGEGGIRGWGEGGKEELLFPHLPTPPSPHLPISPSPHTPSSPSSPHHAASEKYITFPP